MAVAALSLTLTGGAAVLRAQPPQERPVQPAPGVKGPTAGQAYKNVKILKDLPAGELHPAMEYITVALGVGCGYCHDVRNFDNDDKAPKKTARNMMQMTFAINSASFEGQTRVTCYTCHRGQSRGAAAEVYPDDRAVLGKPPNGTYAPVAVPNVTLDSTMTVVQGTPPAGANAKPAPVLPSAEEIIAKYKQALGSADAIQKLSTIIAKGTVEMEIPQPPGPAGAPPAPPVIGRRDAELYRKYPDRVLYLIHMPTSLTLEGYDGFTAWLMGNVSREETGGERAVMQQKGEFFPALRFLEEYSRVKVDSMEKIGNRDVYRVSGFRNDGTGYDHFEADAQTGLVLRMSTNMNSVLGTYPVQLNYDDYRDVNGVKFPFTVREVSPEGQRIYRWDSIEYNGWVETAAFNMPPPPPPPGARPPGGPSTGGAPPAGPPPAGMPPAR